MRQIDILDEISFLCMDLDAYGREDLSDHFYNNYLGYAEVKSTEEVKMLFHYYKCYRANVRAKVHLLNAMETSDQIILAKEIKAATGYFGLLRKYLDRFP